MSRSSPSNCSPCDWRSLLLYALGDHSSVKVRIAELRLYMNQMSKEAFQRRISMMERDLAARRRIVGVIFQSRPKRWWANNQMDTTAPPLETALNLQPGSFAEHLRQQDAKDTAQDPLDAAHGSPVRVTLSRRKGWRMPPNTIKVCRPGRWGNPYRVGVDGDQAECVELFRRNWGMFEQLNHADIVKHLRGKNLACWCKAGTPCHADVLLSLANAQADL